MRTLARECDKAEVLRRLRALRQDSVGRWGRMSAHQMVCHLSDACRAALGERRDDLRFRHAVVVTVDRCVLQ